MAATKRDRKPAGKKAAEKKAPEKKAAGEPSASHEKPHGNTTSVT